MVREIQISTESKTYEELCDHAKQFMDGLDLELTNFDGVYNIFDLIKTCSARSCYNPDWGVLAGRMTQHEINKTAGKTFSKATEMLKKQLHPDYYDFVMSNRDALDSIVDESNSKNRQCISLATVLQNYLLRYNLCHGCGQCEECDRLWCAETMEYMYLRIATFLCMPDIHWIKSYYTLLSRGYISMATPTMFNAGLVRHQMASCFVATIADSLWSIEDYWLAFGEISRNAGGIGFDVSRIRHSLIGEVGKSDGIPALLPTYEAILRYVDQSKKRKGSATAFTAVWHIDIQTFIKMKDPKGADSDASKCLDLTYGVWLNDVFMERVAKEEPWSLFCPKKAPGLTEVFGDEFRELYLKYEREGKARHTIPNARTLLIEMIDAQTTTGMPFLLNADVINRCSMQENIGIIRSSNLCVSGDTKILTDKGQIEIKKLVDEKVNVWNGEDFTSTTIRQTGEDQDMMEVTFSNGTVLKCTPYHKFYIKQRDDNVEAKDLKVGDVLIDWKTPDGNTYNDVKVTSTKQLDEKMDTYCFTEKGRGMGIFNGVITGQCVEITLHTSDQEIASCNLASLCLPKFVKDRRFDWQEFISAIRMTVRVMENVIERNYYPDREIDKRVRNRKMIETMLQKNGILNSDIRYKIAKDIVDNMETNEILPNIRKSNLANRPLGIGLQGFGDAVAKMDWAWVDENGEENQEVSEFNNRIIQTLYYYAVDESANLARELGPYARFEGSPYSKGQLHPDRWQAPDGTRATFLDWFEGVSLDWPALREKVKGGVRHSTLLAMMPTATSSIIAGNSPSLEPINVIVGTKTILSGQHVVLCEEAYHDLKKLGVWTKRLVDEIKHTNKDNYDSQTKISGVGGIQHLSIPPEIADNPIKRARFNFIKQKYRVGYELPPKIVINHTVARTPFVCQSQSMNLWLANPSTQKMLAMYNYGWKKGLKTIIYYARGQSSLQAMDIQSACRGGVCEG